MTAYHVLLGVLALVLGNLLGELPVGKFVLAWAVVLGILVLGLLRGAGQI